MQAYSAEGRHYEDIEQEYPDGVLTILNPDCLETEDDNQMAALLVKTYIKLNGPPVSARDFAQTWKEGFSDPNYYCCSHAYNLICKGVDPRITGHWNIVTGSTVMCMEPVGIYHLCDPAGAYMDAVTISYMYQRGLDTVAASILAASIVEAFRPDGL